MSQPMDYQARRNERLRRLNTENMQGHVYVIEFSSGTVKVGLTKNWTQRLARHTKDAGVHGIAITRSWVSPAHVRWADNERTLIEFCVANFGTASSGNEYFTGADYAAIVAFAEDLHFEPLTHEMAEAARREAASRMEELRAKGLPFTPSASNAPSDPAAPSLIASLSDEQIASFRHRMDREAWVERVRLRREIRAWELSEVGREWAAKYGFATEGVTPARELAEIST